jgi:hypothetical protein
MKAKLVLATLFLALAALPWIAGCGQSSSADFRVTHYVKPGHPACDTMKSGFAALPQEFPGKVVVEEVIVTDSKAARLVRNMDFRECGVVVRGRRGEVLWKAGDHQAGVQDTRKALQELMTQPNA